MMISNRRANNGTINGDRFTGNGRNKDLKFIEIFEKNTSAANEYEPQPYDQTVMVFRAEDSYWYSRKGLSQGLGWAGIAAGGLTLRSLPGDHLSILDPGNVNALAACLKDAIPLRKSREAISNKLLKS